MGPGAGPDPVSIRTASVTDRRHRRRPLPDVDPDGCTPLSYACLQGHVEIVGALLSAGSNKDAAVEVGIVLLLCSSFNIVYTYGILV